MADKLNKAQLDALPHPLFAMRCGLDEWPIHDICVETGLTRIDVVGKLQTIDFAEVLHIRDGEFVTHDADGFYIEDETGNDMHTDTDKQIETLIADREKIEREHPEPMSEDFARLITGINLQIMKLQGKRARNGADIEEKIVWTTKDGQRWDRLEDAIAHQLKGKIIEAIYDAGDLQGAWMATHAEQIASNAAELFAILEPFFRKGY